MNRGYDSFRVPPKKKKNYASANAIATAAPVTIPAIVDLTISANLVVGKLAQT